MSAKVYSDVTLVEEVPPTVGASDASFPDVPSAALADDAAGSGARRVSFRALTRAVPPLLHEQRESQTRQQLAARHQRVMHIRGARVRLDSAALLNHADSGGRGGAPSPTKAAPMTFQSAIATVEAKTHLSVLMRKAGVATRRGVARKDSRVVTSARDAAAAGGRGAVTSAHAARPQWGGRGGRIRSIPRCFRWRGARLAAALPPPRWPPFTVTRT